jgi:hypothetical protein
MAPFNYGAEADLFSGAARFARRQLAVGYRRFGSAAEALRFAIEELSPESLAGAALEVGDQRFGAQDMRRLYDASDYPLARRERERQTSATARRAPRNQGTGGARRAVGKKGR